MLTFAKQVTKVNEKLQEFLDKKINIYIHMDIHTCLTYNQE